jgi:hypothetical protein
LSPVSKIAPRRQLADHFRIDRWLEFEIEGVEGFLKREAGHRDAHREVFLGLGANLEREELVEKVGVRHVAFGGLLEQRGQLRLQAMQPETLTVTAQPIEEGRAHWPPPIVLSAS